MDSPEIRAAKIEDAPAIAELSGQLGYPTSTTHSADRLETILRTDGHVVLVAGLADNTVVGWVHVFQTLRVESSPFAELGGLVVAENSRGLGIGRSLVMAAEKLSVEQGMRLLRVRTRSGRAEARSFYEGLGFALEKEQCVYDKRLGPFA